MLCTEYSSALAMACSHTMCADWCHPGLPGMVHPLARPILWDHAFERVVIIWLVMTDA